MIYFILYVDKLPDQYAGKANAFIICILKTHKDDKGLLEHEKVHVKQFWRCPLHGLLYRYSIEYRLKAEVEAYREQLKYGADIDRLSWFLCEKYDLGLSFDEAKRLLCHQVA